MIHWASASPTPPPWGEAGHDRAGRPEIGHAAHRPDQRIAVRREGEGAVDDLADAGLVEGREVAEADFQLAGDALQVLGQQFMAEIPRGLDGRPRTAVLFIGAHQHAVALLADIDLAVEVDAVHELAADRLVELDDLRHVLGDQIHVLHGEHRQFEPDHAADLAGPQRPAALTTCSQKISPLSVITRQVPSGSCSRSSTLVCR